MLNYEEKAKQYRDIDRMIKELEKEKEAIKGEIIKSMRDDNITRYNGQDYDITLVVKDGYTFDKEKFIELHSALYEAFKIKPSHSEYIRVL